MTKVCRNCIQQRHSSVLRRFAGISGQVYYEKALSMMERLFGVVVSPSASSAGTAATAPICHHPEAAAVLNNLAWLLFKKG